MEYRQCGRSGLRRAEAVTEEWRARLRRLDAVARARGQTIAQLALAWVLRHDVMTSALIGASRAQQVDENVATLRGAPLTRDDLRAIEDALGAAVPSGRAGAD